MNTTLKLAIATMSVVVSCLWQKAIYAASFDCAQAGTKAEKFICSDPFISKLDSQLGKAYVADLEKANPEQKQRLIIEERDWIKNMRNWCTTQTCFKHAYWQRLAELETFYTPHLPMAAKVSDEAAAIQKILTTATVYPLKLNAKECPGIFHALKNMSGVRFVSPIIKAMSYGDPDLIFLRNRVGRMCKGEFPQGAPVTFSYQCNSGVPAPQDLESPTDALGGCLAFYGLPPYKVYKIPSAKSDGHVNYLFSLDAQYGPMNIAGEKPVWIAGGGFKSILYPNCGRDALPEYVNPAADNPIYKEIIEHKGKYYFLIVYRLGLSYWVTVDQVAGREACNWSQTNMNQREK